MPKFTDGARRLRIIHRLALAGQLRGSDEALAAIADVATGKAPAEFPKPLIDSDLGRRLEEGSASRSPRVGQRSAAAVEKKARKERAGRDRAEKAGTNRSMDFDPDKIDKTTDVNV